MSDGYYDDAIFVLKEDDPPISHPKARSGATLKPFHVAFAVSGEFRQAGIYAFSNVSRKLCPLAQRGRSKDNRLHGVLSHIAIIWSRQYRYSR
jgi:hypothetical protein